MSTYPKTEHGIILLGMKNQGNVFSFLCLQSAQNLPGVPIRLEMRRPLYEQLTDYVCTHLLPGLSPLALDWWQDEALELKRDEQDEGAFPLFLAQVKKASEQKFSIPPGYQSILLPQILQSMAKDKNRITYLKAWQALLGTHEETLKAIADQDLSHYNNDKN